jgi:3-(3-hydroxy-phenyl)propionate hydroxylase
VPLEIVQLPSAGLAAERYDAKPGTAYLLRPDQHVAARWRKPQAADVTAAVRRVLGLND